MLLAGIAIPVAVIASFVTDVRAFGGSHDLIAYLLVALGTFIGLLNFHLSFIRPVVLRSRCTPANEPHVSGIPLLGNLAVLGLLLAPPSPGLSVAALVQIALDTGGLQYAVPALWSSLTTKGEGRETRCRWTFFGVFLAIPALAAFAVGHATGRNAMGLISVPVLLLLLSGPGEHLFRWWRRAVWNLH